MFEKLVGNNDAKLTLKRQIAAGRLPNSLLFAGDEGIGKREFAIEVARAFVCGLSAERPCGTCSACRRAGSFVFPSTEKGEDYERVFLSEHPDVGMVVPFKRNVRVNAIRHLEREANFAPYEATARFFIVDDADKMNDAASNALLKTLEEPARTSHIFLITSRADCLLPTIRSRCQIVRFAPIESAEIERFLVSERAFTSDEARLAARLSRGSIGRAISLNVGDIKMRRERMLAVLQGAIAAGDLALMMRISEEMNDAKNKAGFEEDLDILESLIHDIWVLRTSLLEDRVVNTDLVAELRPLAAAARGDLSAWLAAIETLREDMAVNINRRVATDALFSSMAGGR